jgi:hypothetical protein
VGEYEVLSTGLADKPRVRAIVADPVANLLPQALECRSGSGEVNAGQARIGQKNLGDLGTRTIDQV